MQEKVIDLSLNSICFLRNFDCGIKPTLFTKDGGT